MSPEDFDHVAQGVQAIVLGLGALVAGLWALARFRLTGDQQRAKLELETMRRDVQRLRGVSGQIAVRHQKIDSDHYYVNVDVILLNHGSHVKVFRCDNYPFHINKVMFVNGDLEFHEVTRLQVDEAAADREVPARFRVALRLLPDTPYYLSFSYELSDPGSYLFSLVFESGDPTALSPEDEAELKSAREAYDKYRSHPGYVADMKADFTIQRHHYVGATHAASAGAPVGAFATNDAATEALKQYDGA